MDIFGKVWGNTSKIFEHNNVSIHFLNAKCGHKCSKHIHEHKYNKFFVISGCIEISVWKNGYELVDETILEAGMSTTVSPGEYHKFTVHADSKVLEIYWTELADDDIIREGIGS